MHSIARYVLTAVALLSVLVVDLPLAAPARVARAAADRVSVDIGVLPNAILSRAVGVNNRGLVVGCSGPRPQVTHPIIWQNGTLSALPDLSVAGSGCATAINDAGQIAGYSPTAVGSV